MIWLCWAPITQVEIMIGADCDFKVKQLPSGGLRVRLVPQGLLVSLRVRAYIIVVKY